MMSSSRTVLVICQVYLPDPAAVGQQLADAAEELVARGHRVVVLTADRGYDNPRQRFPRHETLNGVRVHRYGWSSFGKGSLLTRLLGGVSFTIQAFVQGLFLPRPDVVLVSTVPPMAASAAAVLSRLRRASLVYSVMDLNPDQLIALGLLGAESFPVRVFNWLNRLVLRQAKLVIVLDRFMRERVLRKASIAEKLRVVPPWPLVEPPGPIPHAENPFRQRLGLGDERIIMYSGNHGVTSPLTTLLRAAESLAHDARLKFYFVGGGAGKHEVEAATSPHLVSLPYQPLAELEHSLSAADVHVVTLGASLVGIVHPCKVYGAMAVSRPILLLGPEECHVSDLLAGKHAGWTVQHGDVDGAVRVLREIAELPRSELEAMGLRAREVVNAGFTRRQLRGRFCDLVEEAATPFSAMPAGTGASRNT